MLRKIFNMSRRSLSPILFMNICCFLHTPFHKGSLGQWHEFKGIRALDKSQYLWLIVDPSINITNLLSTRWCMDCITQKQTSASSPQCPLSVTSVALQKDYWLFDFALLHSTFKLLSKESQPNHNQAIFKCSAETSQLLYDLQIALQVGMLVANKLPLLTWKSSTPPCSALRLREMLSIRQMERLCLQKPTTQNRCERKWGSFFGTVSLYPTSMMIVYFTFWPVWQHERVWYLNTTHLYVLLPLAPML